LNNGENESLLPKNNLITAALLHLVSSNSNQLLYIAQQRLIAGW